MSETVKKKLSAPKIGAQELLVLAFAAVVFFINIRIVGKCYNPFVFNDEMGYWTHAATMAGKDWTGVSNTLAWYSFGYSFMLVPIMKIFHDPVAMYRAALVLNVIMLTAVYFLYIFIIRYLFPKLQRAQAAFLAAAAVLYTSYQLNAGIAFSETALLFVTTLIAFTLVRIMRKPSFLNLGCLGALCAYLFMIHNRTIGIVASVLLTVGLAVLFRKVKMRHAAVFAVVLGLGFIANSLIRDHLEGIQWISGHAGGNNADSVLGNIRTAVSSWGSIKRLLSLLASQAFAAFTATFGIALFSLWAIFRRLIAVLADAVKALRSKSALSEAADGQFFIILFIFCAFVSTWIISSVFMFNFQRIDHIVYTRYYDIVVGLLIITGLRYMYNPNKHDLMFTAAMPFIMAAGANRAAVLFNNVGTKVFSRVCSPGLSRLYDTFDSNYYAYAMTAAAVFGIIMLIMQIKKFNGGFYSAALITAALFVSYTPEAKTDIYNNQRVYSGDRELVSRIKDMSPEKIYIAPDVGTFASFLQFMMNDVKVEYADHPERLSEDALILVDRKSIIEICDYEIIDKSDRHLLIRNKLNTDNEDFQLPLSYMYTFDSDMYIADEDMIKSDPDNNYLCYGPYLKLSEGDYEFLLDMTFDEINTENIGFAEIKSGSVNTIYAHTDITPDMIGSSGELRLELTADVGVPIPDVEIIVFLYEPAAVSMQLNSIEVNMED